MSVNTSISFTPNALAKVFSYSNSDFGWDANTFSFLIANTDEKKASTTAAAGTINAASAPAASTLEINTLKQIVPQFIGQSDVFDQHVQAIVNKSDQITDPASSGALSDSTISPTKLLAAKRNGTLDNVATELKIRNLMAEGKSPAAILSEISTNPTITQNTGSIFSQLQSGLSLDSIISSSPISATFGESGKYLVGALAQQGKIVQQGTLDQNLISSIFSNFNPASISPASFLTLFNFQKTGGTPLAKAGVYHVAPSANLAVNQAEPLNFSDSRPAPSLNDAYPGESQINRLATGQDIHKTIVQTKDSTRERNIPIALKDEVYDEPSSPYNAAPPHNQVRATKNGLVEEYDDTPNNVRYHRFHPSGTYTEIDNNGTQVTKVVGDNYEVIAHNNHVYIKGQCNITIEGDSNILVKNSVNMEVEGSMKAVVKNDLSFTINGSAAINVGEQLKFKAQHIFFESEEMDIVADSLTGRLTKGLDFASEYMRFKAVEDVSFTSRQHMISAEQLAQIRTDKWVIGAGSLAQITSAKFIAKASDKAQLSGQIIVLDTPDVYFNQANIHAIKAGTYVEGNVNLGFSNTPTGNTFRSNTKFLDVIDNEETSTLSTINIIDNNEPRDAISTFLGMPGLRSTPTVPILPDLPRMSREHRAAMECDGSVGVGSFSTVRPLFIGGDTSTNAPPARVSNHQVSIDETLYPGASTADKLSDDMESVYNDKKFTTYNPVKVDSSLIKHKDIDTSDIQSARNFDPHFKLSKHFTLGQAMDMVNWPIRPQNGLSVQQIVANMRRAAINILDPLVEIYGRGNIRVTSGWRLGTGGSHHNIGCAYDVMFLDVPKALYPARAAEVAAAFKPICDQIIYEYNWSGNDYQCNWIHLSYIGTNPRPTSDQFKVFTRCENAKINYAGGIYDPYKGRKTPSVAVSTQGNRPSGSII